MRVCVCVFVCACLGDECVVYEDQAAEGYKVICTKVAASCDRSRGCCAKAFYCRCPTKFGFLEETDHDKFLVNLIN